MNNWYGSFHNEIIIALYASLFKRNGISSQDGDDATLNQLRNHCQKLINFDWIEDNYKQALFVVSNIPIGLFIESIPVTHLSHLQSDLRLADEWHYLNLDKRQTQFIPSVLFVDTESEDLTSEIPEICR